MNAGKSTLLKQKAIDSASQGKRVYYISLTSATKGGSVRKTRGIFDLLTKREMRQKGVTMMNAQDLEKAFQKRLERQQLDTFIEAIKTLFQSMDDRNTNLNSIVEEEYPSNITYKHENFMKIDIYKYLISFLEEHRSDVIMVDEFPLFPKLFEPCK